MDDNRSDGSPVRLAAIRDEPLSVDEVLAAVANPGAGGTAVFLGTVRDHDGDRAVVRLAYSAHDSAEEHLAAVTERVARAHEAIAAAATHRVGELAVGDLAVVVAVSAAHRAEALTACRELIDELKATVPIWKHQVFRDGTDEWVGSP